MPLLWWRAGWPVSACSGRSSSRALLQSSWCCPFTCSWQTGGIAAILALVVAVTVHPTYLLCGGLLTLAYLWVIFRETRQIKAVMLYGLKVLVPVLPILAYTLVTFRPSNPILYAEAQHVLVYFRIPPHALVGQWLNWTVAVQCIIVLAALVVLAGSAFSPYS